MQAVHLMHIKDEHRWHPGSWLALAFALFIFTWQVGYSIYTLNMPTDGWLIQLQNRAVSPEISFSAYFLDTPTPIKPGDQLLTVNGLTNEQIQARQHRFFTMTAPNWPDGTVQKYQVLRDGKQLSLEVPLSRQPW